MQDAKALLAYIQQEWQQRILPTLMDYIKIPNKSPHFEPDWEKKGFMLKAAQLLANWAREHGPAGLQVELIQLPGKTPLLLMELAGQTDETVLLYGHLDKQPEFAGWQPGLGPWQPVLSEGRLYGRGAADDGYAVFSAVTALKALSAFKLPHPRCLILIEASEESGSYDLPFYIEHLQQRIAKPSLVICLDSGAGDYERLWLTTSLRGNLVGELSVSLFSEGVHSGQASGIAADSFRVIRALLSRIEDEQTGKHCLAGLHCAIPTHRLQQARASAFILQDELLQSLPFHQGTVPLSQDLSELLLNRTWRPALTVTGAEGLPALVDAGNVLRPKTVLKLSLRLPPLVNASEAAQQLAATLTTAPPYGAEVSFQLKDAASGWHAPAEEPWLLKACQDASLTFYQQPAAFIGEGGTIPFMAMLGERFPKAQFVITGVLGPHANAHGPNEFLDLKMVEKLTACIAFILNKMSQHSLLRGGSE